MCSSALLHQAGVCFSRREVIRAAGAAALAGVGSALAAGPAKADAQPKLADLGPMIQFQPGRVIDLTHALTPDFPVFPGGRRMAILPRTKVKPDGYLTSRWELDEHTGTHMDAPAHFIEDGVTADLIPVATLICPIVLIDISERAKRDADATVTIDDLRAWEKAHGRTPNGAVVVMRSGWESRLAKAGAFLNQDKAGVMHSPGFSGDLAKFLVQERSIHGVAVDTISLDIGSSQTFESHRVLLGAGKWGVENLANLGQVPAAGATMIVSPTKVRAASGGPVRVYACLPV